MNGWSRRPPPRGAPRARPPTWPVRRAGCAAGRGRGWCAAPAVARCRVCVNDESLSRVQAPRAQGKKLRTTLLPYFFPLAVRSTRTASRVFRLLTTQNTTIPWKAQPPVGHLGCVIRALGRWRGHHAPPRRWDSGRSPGTVSSVSSVSSVPIAVRALAARRCRARLDAIGPATKPVAPRALGVAAGVVVTPRLRRTHARLAAARALREDDDIAAVSWVALGPVAEVALAATVFAIDHCPLRCGQAAVTHSVRLR